MSGTTSTNQGRRPQRTLAREAGLRGVGFLTGADVSLRFVPAPADHGIVFVRDDLPGCPSVPAALEHVAPRQRRTALQRGAATVELVEHVMAALAGLRIDNCSVHLDAGEAPGCDGSSRAFVSALSEAGFVEQDRLRGQLVIDRPVTVSADRATLTALPGPADLLTMTYHLDYGRSSPIPRQGLTLDVTPESFRDELADSRTFLLAEEVEGLRRQGIGSRTGPKDLLIFGPDGPIDNAVRHPDECARHKMLDLVGDLALLGRDLVGQVVAHRSGHQLNAALARKLAEQANPPSPLVMDVRRILEILPHRYPFLLVDQVRQIDRDRLVAIKNVTVNEPFFAGHWPGAPTMPGVLILEALAQAGGLLIWSATRQSSQRAVVASIDRAKFRRPVVPGDQLLLDVTLARAKGRAMEVHGVAKVNDQVAAEANIRIMILD